MCVLLRLCLFRSISLMTGLSLSFNNVYMNKGTQSSYRYTHKLSTHFLTWQPLTDTHTNTHVSEINFNSPVREQISRQPFISSASLTLPLHCPLLSIDLSHTRFLLPLFIYSSFLPLILPLHRLNLYFLASLSLSLSLYLKAALLSPLCALTVSNTHPQPKQAHISLNEVNFQSMRSYWPSAEVAHIVKLYWTGHICAPVWLFLWSCVCLSCSMSARACEFIPDDRGEFIYLSSVIPACFSLLA